MSENLFFFLFRFGRVKLFTFFTVFTVPKKRFKYPFQSHLKVFLHTVFLQNSL